MFRPMIAPEALSEFPENSVTAYAARSSLPPEPECARTEGRSSRLYNLRVVESVANVQCV